MGIRSESRHPGTGLGAACAGLLIAAVMVYVAWQHNPQEQFHGEEGIHWANLAGVGASWFAAVAGALFVSTMTIVLVVAGLRRLPGDDNRAHRGRRGQ